MLNIRSFSFAFFLVCISLTVAMKRKFEQTLDESWTNPKKEGDAIPSVTLKTRTRVDANVENPFDWKDRTTEELFKGKRIVFFALPGAFTVRPKHDWMRLDLIFSKNCSSVISCIAAYCP